MKINHQGQVQSPCKRKWCFARKKKKRKTTQSRPKFMWFSGAFQQFSLSAHTSLWLAVPVGDHHGHSGLCERGKRATWTTLAALFTYDTTAKHHTSQHQTLRRVHKNKQWCNKVRSDVTSPAVIRLAPVTSEYHKAEASWRRQRGIHLNSITPLFNNLPTKPGQDLPPCTGTRRRSYTRVVGAREKGVKEAEPWDGTLAAMFKNRPTHAHTTHT